MNSKISASAIALIAICYSIPALATDYAPQAQRFIPSSPPAPTAERFIPQAPAAPSASTYSPYVERVSQVPVAPKANYVAPPAFISPQDAMVPTVQTTSSWDPAPRAETFIPQAPPAPQAQRFQP
ncbi:MAG: hypothetical protein WCD70_10600 [Alphaproteobacteria bacterium]